MIPRITLRGALALAAMLSLSAAHAQIFRAYLASTGLDSNPCTLAAPCRLLPAALAAVADGGEIWILDSANYNVATVNLGKSATILAVPEALGSVVATGGSAISIATAGVKVTLRNLVIVPLPGAGGTRGIEMTAGAALTVEGCLIASLAGEGIRVSTPASVRVTDSTIRGNLEGIALLDGASGTVTRTTVSAHSGVGIEVRGALGGTTTTADIADSTLVENVVGATAISDAGTAVVKVSVRGSRVARNFMGLTINSTAGAAILLSASNNIVSNNTVYGISAFNAGSRVWASGNTVSDNGSYGLNNSGGLFETAGNNAVRNNAPGETGGVISAIPTM
jgi:hypothetical protein